MADLSEENRKAWDERSKNYDTADWTKKLALQLTVEIRNRLDFIGAPWSSPLNKDEVKLLDYACGTGMVTRALQDHVTTAVGMDVSQGMVSTYTERMTADGITKASAVVGNLLAPVATPAATETNYTGFDVAVVGLGFHHFEDSKLTLERLAERVKPRTGVVVILDWLPSDRDPNYEGPKGGHTHHHHGHGHGHGDAKPQKTDGQDPFKEMRHTIAHDGFDAEMMKELYESAGLVDFGFEVMADPVVLMLHDTVVKKTPFLARGRRP